MDDDSPPVGLVEFVLPQQRSALRHAVVPQHQAAGHPLVHLVGQVAQEQRGVLHCNRLASKGRAELGYKSTFKTLEVWGFFTPSSLCVLHLAQTPE